MIRAGLLAGILLTAAPARTQEAALAEFVAKVLAEGKAGRIMSMPAAHLGIAKGSAQKSLTAAPRECEDGSERSFAALTQGPPASPSARELVLKTYRRDLKLWRVQRVLLRLKPDGTIIKAVVGAGDLTPTGGDKKGSFVPRTPEPDEAKKLLRRELDFWLLGAGRRPPDAPEPPRPGRHSK